MGDGFGELDVALCVLVAWVDFCVVGKRSEGFVERFVHFLGGAFEEAATAADEEGVAGEDGAVVAVFGEEADVVLGVAWGVEGSDFYGADVEGGVVAWGLGDALAVAAADYGDVE